eukprot:m.132591 g.132591  ORF g.132591 m.132591 type:complete len:74 (+) comp11336_c1_seq4:785-1006(+)
MLRGKLSTPESLSYQTLRFQCFTTTQTSTTVHHKTAPPHHHSATTLGHVTSRHVPANQAGLPGINQHDTVAAP